MSYGNLHLRPDLSPLFGRLEREEHDFILDELLQIDGRLKALAQEAEDHIGVAYQHTGLGLFIRERDSEIAGGPGGSAGDIWCEIGYSFDESSRRSHVPPWTVDSRIVVFCEDPDPGTRGSSCTHDLVRLVDEADTPAATVRALAAHVEALSKELRKRNRAAFTKTSHADLVVGKCNG